MPWIMAKRRAKSTAGGKSLSERWNTLRPALVAGAWATTLIGSALALGMGVPALRHQAMSNRVDGTLGVVFNDQPSWMTDAELMPLATEAAKHVTGSPMDRAGLAQAREALMATGWFEEVHQVRRSGTSELTVDADWVTPFAVVRDDGYDYLVDLNGRLLPRCYRPGTAPRGFIRIEGAVQPRPKTYGTRWGGDDVKAALAVARLIEDRPWRSQVAWIDLSETARDGCIRLKTSRDVTLRWGRAPGQEGAAEVPARQKLDYLGWLFDHQGRIDAGCEQQLDLMNDYVGVR